MGYIDLAIDPSPSGTGYDDSLPTRNNELLAAQIHNTIQDMGDSGFWYLYDGVNNATDKTEIKTNIRTWVKAVFDYALSAIQQFRASGTVTLVEPTASDFGNPWHDFELPAAQMQWDLWKECMKMKYLIYYLWQSEEDPLRVKDYIRDMLIAWPLLDTTISLKDEGGSELKIYPSWNEFG